MECGAGPEAAESGRPWALRKTSRFCYLFIHNTTLPVRGEVWCAHAHPGAAAALARSHRCRIAEVFYGDFCNELRFIVATECRSKIYFIDKTYERDYNQFYWNKTRR